MTDNLWVNCFLMPTDLLRSEMTYRVRRHDGSVVEGTCIRRDAAPTFSYVIEKADKKTKKREIKAQWGVLGVVALEKGAEKTLILLPDDQVVLVKNSRLHENPTLVQ